MKHVADLANRLAVVTGASRGIGRATAVAFARAGARVVGCARKPEGAGFLDDLDAQQRERCRMVVCDVRDGEQVNRFRAEVEDGVGPVDVLVNNAGTVARASVESLSQDTWNDVLASNLTGTFLMTRAFVAGMKARRCGRIINLSSIAGRLGTPMLSAYCAAKHGVVGFTRSLAEELRPEGITVNAICPGSVDTEMLGQGMPGATPRMTPDDVAAVALFLATAAPAALTGACIDVFG